MTRTPRPLAEFLCTLKSPPPAPRPAGSESRTELIARISTPGLAHAVDGTTYDYFLEVLPPRWMCLEGFAFGEGADPLTLFWIAPGGEQFFCRRLTEDETGEFCRRAGIGRSSG